MHLPIPIRLARHGCAIVLIGTALTGCATEWRHQAATTTEKGAWRLHSQRSSTVPVQGMVPIEAADLRAGDILFSAEKGFNSVGIRLFNQASVSHAFVYLGDGQIAEVVGSGVHIQPLDQATAHSTVLAAYRHPQLTPEAVDKIRQFAHSLDGSRYNFSGIAKQAPYSLTRKACELPVIPRAVRHLCVNSLALVQVTPFSSQRYFCSQFVIEAFNRAGTPLTETKPEWVSPGDILHLREDDVAAVTPMTRLVYVGHLRCSESLWNPSCQLAPPTPGHQAA